MHDSPEFAQVGLRDQIVRFELKRTQVVGLSLNKLTIKMEDSPKVHQSSSILKESKIRTKIKAEKEL